MAIKKTSLVIKQYDLQDVIVGVWLSQSALDEIEAKVGDFIYASIGWSGSKSFRAVVKGLLPEGFDQNVMAATGDRIYEGNMKEGETCRVWKHTNWF